MIRTGTADDFHAKNIPVEFRRGRWVCGVQSNMMDTGIATPNMFTHVSFEWFHDSTPQ
jgi:hypothetical protein